MISKILKYSPFLLIKYPMMAIIAIIFTLLSWILSPILALYSVIFNVKILPGFLQYFSTLDDDLDGGQHQQPDSYPSGVTGFKLWWQRTCWICRNPSQGWAGRVLGFSDEGFKIISETDGIETMQWSSGGDEYFNIMEDANGKRYFTFRKNWKLSKKYYIKTWIGWGYKPVAEYHTIETQFGWIRKFK